MRKRSHEEVTEVFPGNHRARRADDPRYATEVDLSSRADAWLFGPGRSEINCKHGNLDVTDELGAPEIQEAAHPRAVRRATPM